jgi:hypothetical protein
MKSACNPLQVNTEKDATIVVQGFGDVFMAEHREKMKAYQAKAREVVFNTGVGLMCQPRDRFIDLRMLCPLSPAIRGIGAAPTLTAEPFRVAVQLLPGPCPGVENLDAQQAYLEKYRWVMDGGLTREDEPRYQEWMVKLVTCTKPSIVKKEFEKYTAEQRLTEGIQKVKSARSRLYRSRQGGR